MLTEKVRQDFSFTRIQHQARNLRSKPLHVRDVIICGAVARASVENWAWLVGASHFGLWGFTTTSSKTTNI